MGRDSHNGCFEQRDQPQPGDHGFDYYFGTQNLALPNHRNPTNFFRNGQPVGPLKGYAAELVSEEAIRWLAEKRDKAKPFFFWLGNTDSARHRWRYEPEAWVGLDPAKLKVPPQFPDDPAMAGFRYFARIQSR